MTEEKNNVMFCTLQNSAGTGTLNVTFRGDDAASLLQDVRSFIQAVDPNADLTFKFKDVVRSYGGGGGKFGNKSKVTIKDNQFIVKSFARVEDAKKPKEGQAAPVHANWSHMELYGEQDGEEIKVKVFVGDPGWNNGKPCTLEILGFFPDFMTWPVGVKKTPTIAPDVMRATVQPNEQYHNYDLVKLERVGAAPGIALA